MRRQFGGISGFAKRWKAAMDTAQEQHRMCSVLRSFRVIAELSNVAERRRKAEKAEVAADTEGFDDMTVDEIRQTQADALRRFFLSHPHVAIEAAAALGWELRPPGEQEFMRA